MKLSNRAIKRAEKIEERQSKGLPINRKERRILAAVSEKMGVEE